MDNSIQPANQTNGLDTIGKKSSSILAVLLKYPTQLLDSLSEMILVYDVDLSVVWANKSAARFLGMDAEELVGKKCNDLFHRVPSACTECALIEGLKPGLVTECQKLTGSEQHITVRGVSLFDGDKPVGLLQTITDNSKQKKAEKKFKLSEERFRMAFDNSPTGMAIISLAGDFLLLNNALASMLNYQKEELIAKHISKIVHKDDFDDDFKEFLAPTAGSIDSFRGERRLVGRYGSIGIGLIDASTIAYDNGKTAFFMMQVQDITHKKAGEKLLTESLSLLKSIFMAAPIGIGVIKNRRMGYYNKKFEEMSGFTTDEIKGKNFIVLFPCFEECLKAVREIQVQIRAKGFGQISTRLRCKNGEIKDVFVSASSVKERNSLSELIVTAVDMSEIKKASSKIRKLTAGVEQSSNMIIITTTDGTIEYVNQKFSEVTGWSMEEVDGRKPSILKSGYHMRDFYEELWNEITSGKSWRGEIFNKKKNGDYFWDSSHISPIFDENGKISNFIAIKDDITEKKRIEDTLRKSRANLMSVIENNPDMICMVDFHGRMIVCNKSFEKHYHATWNYLPLPGMILENHQPVDIKIDSDNNMRQVLNGNILKFEMPLSSVPAEKYYEMFYYPIRVESRVVGFSTFTRDISERKLAEIQLIKAKEAAEEANRLKAIIMQNIGHELRTPLNGILGFSQILSEELKDPDYREMAGLVSQSGKRLEKTLNSIMAISEIETNSIEVNPDMISLNQYLEMTATKFESDCNAKGLTMTFLQREQDIYAYADEYILNQIIFNLIDNGIKFTKNGGITLDSATMVSDGRKMALIKVIDTGIGISSDNLSIIFDEFRQGSEGLSREYEGIGLGLAISRKLVNLMGGSIRAKSVIDEGTEFTIALPSSPVEEIANGKAFALTNEIPQ